MQRVLPDHPWPLFDVPAIRRLEQQAAAALPPHTLMQRAGLAVARLTLALAPHAGRIWVACGPGNNGGDGFLLGVLAREAGLQVDVVVLEDTSRGDGASARAAWVDAGGPVHAVDALDGLPLPDVQVDALYGIGLNRARG